MKKIISTILALATLLGCLAALPIGAFAAENGDTIQTIPVLDPTLVTNPALKQAYATAQDKLDNDPYMVHYVSIGTKQLWANMYTGEVYIKDTATGQILTTNPYDVSGVGSTIAKQVMSQIALTYDIANSSSKSGKTLYSFEESSERGQLHLTQIVNGVRLEYAIGDTTKRSVMPSGIMSKNFIELIMVPMQKEIATLMYEMAEANGVSEAVLADKFDFEAYCEKYITRFSTMDKYGVEYTYGNIEAFDRWSSEAERAYTSYYNDYRRTHTAAETALLNTTEQMTALLSDFVELNQVYTEITPYLGWRLNANRENWTLDEESIEKYPILAVTGTDPDTGDLIYVNSFFALDDTLKDTPRKLKYYESIFIKYASNYTLDDALAAEEETGVPALTVESPVFRVALEYILTAEGVSVSMPAGSIIYDETKYTVNQIKVLPYLGTGKVTEGGYIFYPDGSGTILNFDDFSTTAAEVTGKVYGQDYAYYSISGQHQESVAMPVYGTVKDENAYYFIDPYTGAHIPCTKAQYQAEKYEITYTVSASRTAVANYPFGKTATVSTYFSQYDSYGSRNNTQLPINATDATASNYATNVKTVVSGAANFGIDSTSVNGYVAIIEEGAALATMNISVTPQANNPFSSVCASYVPRAKDTYDLADSMDSISSSASFSVLSDTKYMGAYTTRIIMLSDPDKAAAASLSSYYPASYVGMAAAYQQYLIDNGVLTALTEENVEDQLPLYIESFGVIQSTKKILSIPFTVDVALTTFDDVQTMYEELSSFGITNVKFRLSGFANGGMFATTYPVKIKWESKAGGKSGYKDLLAYAAANTSGLEIFPNFNFLYLKNDKAGDGVRLKNEGARSVDNRYALKKTYDSVYQQFVSNAMIVVNTSRIEELFSKFNRKNTKYKNSAISLDYVASDLSSDFNETTALNRDESMNNVISFLRSVREAGYTSVMSSGGNAYAFPYVDYLLSAPLDSSHYRVTSYPVPFWGMVMHGYMNYTGSAFNEKANKDEALLRAIESGASLYFLLSYDNTRLLKDSALLSDYYSVNYQISKDTLQKYYQILNDAIGDLQTYRIVDHKQIYSERVGLAEDVERYTLLLQTEFMQQLDAETEAAVEEQRAILRELISISGAIRFDEPYANQSNSVKTNLQTFIYSYGTNPRINSIIGDNPIATQVENLFNAVVNGDIDLAYGQSIGVSFDVEAVLASAKAALYTDTLSEAFETEIRAHITEKTIVSPELTAEIGEFSYDSAYRYFTDSHALDKDYKKTESTVSNGTVVMVTYSNGVDTVSFILNFNIFSVQVSLEGQDVITIGKYGFKVLD